VVVKANWRDNPWFPSVLDDERKLDLERYPERYDHIWEGGYAKAFEGAYFATLLTKARLDKRITRVPVDPMMPIRAFWDIGGAGARADAMAIWLVQWTGHEIRIVDYIEGVGQVLSYYVTEMRRRGYAGAICYLPHDGVATNNITGKRYADHLRDAEFDVMVVPNQGAGAAMMRIEAVRRILPRCVFDEAKTEAGRDALGFYHERKDEARNVGLGPEHDWSSHASDGFGLMAICYEGPDSPLNLNDLFDADFRKRKPLKRDGLLMKFDAATIREELEALESKLKDTPRDSKLLGLYLSNARKLRDMEFQASSGYVTPART
jgi:phage terminase large subunit